MAFSLGSRFHIMAKDAFENLKKLTSAIQNLAILKQKNQVEIDAWRVAGPFKDPPFPNLQVSPLGLVSKKAVGELSHSAFVFT